MVSKFRCLNYNKYIIYYAINYITFNYSNTATVHLYPYR